jgi:hypothetical protein
MIPYKVRVDHKRLSPFFSFYEIEASSWHDAEREAKQRFKDSFCNSDTPLTDLEAFTIDKYLTHYKNENEINKPLK